MPLIPQAVVGAYSRPILIVFKDGDDDSPTQGYFEDDSTLALATALGSHITLNGVPVCGEAMI